MRTKTLPLFAIIVAAILLHSRSGVAEQVITLDNSTREIRQIFPFMCVNDNAAVTVPTSWPPHLVFIYRDVPAFSLKVGDSVAFDLHAPVINADGTNFNIQLDIAFAATLINGGEEPDAAGFTVVADDAQPVDPNGDRDVLGDYDLRFVAQQPFEFAGGGLVVRFSEPGAGLATAVGAVACGAANRIIVSDGANDPATFFVNGYRNDLDGLFPWANAAGQAVTTPVAYMQLRISECGDGEQASNEMCDDGNDIDTDACVAACIPAACGDGFVQDGVETCDDGNDIDTDDCPSTCASATCGDGFVEAGVEDCDSGGEASDTCNADCTASASAFARGSGGCRVGSASTLLGALLLLVGVALLYRGRGRRAR